MIRINVNEQQLFDMIMAVYATGADGADQDAQSTKRREALLNKLHRAFDNKIMTSDHAPIRTRQKKSAVPADAAQPIALA
ncbi:MAG: hypothetical protein LAP40_20485 [Acidobacteriia bacterium]|nr:hypothetical protein [Terriglobia bacterium]